MNLFTKKIGSIVEENYRYARALDNVGIDFSLYKNHSLEDIAHLKRVEKSAVVRSFYISDSVYRPSFREIQSFPISMLVSYLRVSHTHYIKEMLPYIQRLLDRVPVGDHESTNDLKAVFPLFVEDFIHHIYEEEDELFTYIILLDRVARYNERGDYEKIVEFADLSLKDILKEHQEEDEMKSLRELAENLPVSCLELKIALKELQSFDMELQYHAEIENHMLFPKAISLEEKVWAEVARLNQSH